MWMSSMTWGVKMPLWPSTCVFRLSFFLVVGSVTGAFFSFAMVCFPFSQYLENELLLGGLEVVVVPKLPAGDDLLHVPRAPRRLEAIHLQLALEPLYVEIGHVGRYGIDAQPIDLPADIDRAVVHRVAEVLAGIAQDHHASALHHETAERAGPPADDDRAALHVDAHAGTHIAPADEVAAAQRGAESRSRVLVDDHGPGEHVLRARPADTALDVDVRSVDQAAAEIAEAAFDGEVQPVEDADCQRMLGARILHHHAAVALVHEFAQLQIDFARTHRTGVELRALFEVDFECLRRGEPLLFLRPEKALLRASRELLGVHSQVRSFCRGCHSFSRGLMRNRFQFFQTRTSPS